MNSSSRNPVPQEVIGLRERRQRLSLSVPQLAVFSGISFGTLSNAERGYGRHLTDAEINALKHTLGALERIRRSAGGRLLAAS